MRVLCARLCRIRSYCFFFNQLELVSSLLGMFSLPDVFVWRACPRTSHVSHAGDRANDTDRNVSGLTSVQLAHASLLIRVTGSINKNRFCVGILDKIGTI